MGWINNILKKMKEEKSDGSEVETDKSETEMTMSKAEITMSKANINEGAGGAEVKKGAGAVEISETAVFREIDIRVDGVKVGHAEIRIRGGEKVELSEGEVHLSNFEIYEPFQNKGYGSRDTK